VPELGRPKRRRGRRGRRGRADARTVSVVAAGAGGSCRRLVPQVVTRHGSRVGLGHELGAGHRFEQQQVGRIRLVPARDEAVDEAGRSVRPEHEIRPPGTGRHRPVGVGDGLDGPGHRGPDRHDAATVPPRVPQQPSGHLRYHVPLGGRWLVALKRGHARVQQHRRHGDAAHDEVGHDPLGERASGGGHLGAPGMPCHRRLVRRQGRSPVEVAVADRPAVAGQLVLDRTVEEEACQPQPPAGRVRWLHQPQAATGTQPHQLARLPVGDPSTAVGAAQLHHVGTGWRRAGHVHGNGASTLARGIQRRGERG
jgi:hypothetical protein